MSAIRSLLIANRGEIAARIARTARDLGVRTVAVYSEADASAPHVRACDEAYLIGPAPAAESYLVADKILDVAKQSGADAIHPGYGFLSENAGFAKAVAEAGLTFVGPPASSISAMGDKAAAKRAMEEAAVPLVPGYHGTDQDPDLLAKEADRIGYPVLLKASAGGGGKGMKPVFSADEFADGLASAKREAKAAFGDDTMIIEKYLVRPRHIEIQVFADSHGNAVHLFERDCSVQRRHQKIIEEAPAPGMTAEMRASMGEAAVAAAKAISYSGAGTVEFIVDQDGSFFFMEMNTRLQVEHPVTEAITGLDLVALQLAVAGGQALPFAQEELAINGHAFEARLYAEDPDKGFLPQIGPLSILRLPEDRARIDSGVEVGGEVSVHYDPMIAKIITHGPDRETALARLEAALAETAVLGVATNTAFLKKLAGHLAFRAGDVHTRFIEQHEADLLPALGTPPSDVLFQAALGLMEDRKRQALEHAKGSGDPTSPWAQADRFRLRGLSEEALVFFDGEADRTVTVGHRAGRVVSLSEGSNTSSDVTLAGPVDRVRNDVLVRDPKTGLRYTVRWMDPTEGFDQASDAEGGLKAPMAGRITQVMVQGGAQVSAGAALLVMEAMKMEYTIKAPADGTVTAVLVGEGDAVQDGASLIDFEADA